MLPTTCNCWHVKVNQSKPMTQPEDFQYPSLKVSWPTRQVAQIAFNRPEKRNALNLEMVDDIRAALKTLAKHPHLKCLIFSSTNDKAFVSGADIAELKSRTFHDALAQINTSLFREIETFPYPTLALIRGAALGGGLELALACDLRFCDESAQMGQPELTLGIMPAAGGCYRLPRLIGVAKAKELIFSAKILRGQACQTWGLVQQCVAPADLTAVVMDTAEAIAKQTQLSLRHAKLALSQFSAPQAAYNQALESALQGYLFADPEKDARMQNFFDRKK